MTKYIDKADLVLRVEKLQSEIAEEKKLYEDNSMWYNGINHGFNLTKDILDTLEVKEVDLDETKKESLAQDYIDYTFKRHNIDYDSKEGQLIYYAYMHGMNQCLNQLKAQKGE